LGAILSQLDEKNASWYVKMLQSSEPKTQDVTSIEMIAQP